MHHSFYSDKRYSDRLSLKISKLTHIISRKIKFPLVEGQE